MDDAAEFCCADDVVQTNGRCFFRRSCEVWCQVIAGRVRSLFVVVAAPDAADVIQMLFGNDDKLIEALRLQCLDEAFDVGSQVG